MTRRHDALIPLTHDHHHALHNLRLLRDSADGDDATRLAGARAFAAFFREHSVPHFREEEEQIFPLVIAHADAPMEGIARVLLEHVQLHALISELEEQIDHGSVYAGLMRDLAALLRAHVRFEEDELFPAIERVVPDRLAGVTLPERERR